MQICGICGEHTLILHAFTVDLLEQEDLLLPSSLVFCVTIAVLRCMFKDQVSANLCFFFHTGLVLGHKYFNEPMTSYFLPSSCQDMVRSKPPCRRAKAAQDRTPRPVRRPAREVFLPVLLFVKNTPLSTFFPFFVLLFGRCSPQVPAAPSQ